MVSKKCWLICLLTFSFLFGTSSVYAAPPENELNQYLAQIGWTKQELQDYLANFEISLEDFETVEDLKLFVGTPINATNLQELLTRYSLTEPELNELLDHFGDSVSEYEVIEDLDAAVDFYVNHDEYMADVETELAKIGLTEAETEKFFTYLAEVEEKNKDQLDQMEAFDARLEKFLFVDDPSELSDEELDEVVQILTETIALYEIDVKFKVDNKDISLKELLKMKELPNSLAASIYSTAGELLIDFSIPAEFFESMSALEEGEEMLHVGELSDEFVDHLHKEKFENNGMK
ncbi:MULTISPECIES: processed acidic surface protein [unclassified Bacillus (in: firmicutes)]|uniref:processed acidic surface protein n=1 Tax=unclassified Bacillus (in: firmicutes) TaxID=185979 RepID=UPI0008EB8E1D|nr:MULTISPECIES: processed acidic surface protein [unclassified Bacillus (in: firmicutes)]SFB04517.1 processed acidic surface protein [Bacillus sp. UNCCL13]SFQ88494.1 processed acidic surface protein [Bacillus sp. cl95]